jgi:nicotinamide mononucleotide (NMN) deamidase PncC
VTPGLVKGRFSENTLACVGERGPGAAQQATDAGQFWASSAAFRATQAVTREALPIRYSQVRHQARHRQ